MQTTIFATKDIEKFLLDIDFIKELLAFKKVVISLLFGFFQQLSQSHNSLKIVLIDANESPQ